MDTTSDTATLLLQSGASSGASSWPTPTSPGTCRRTRSRLSSSPDRLDLRVRPCCWRAAALAVLSGLVLQVT